MFFTAFDMLKYIIIRDTGAFSLGQLEKEGKDVCSMPTSLWAAAQQPEKTDIQSYKKRTIILSSLD